MLINFGGYYRKALKFTQYIRKSRESLYVSTNLHYSPPDFWQIPLLTAKNMEEAEKLTFVEEDKEKLSNKVPLESICSVGGNELIIFAVTVLFC